MSVCSSTSGVSLSKPIKSVMLGKSHLLAFPFIFMAVTWVAHPGGSLVYGLRALQNKQSLAKHLYIMNHLIKYIHFLYGA